MKQNHKEDILQAVSYSDVTIKPRPETKSVK